MNSSLLDKIHQPSDLKKLTSGQVEALCEEIRKFLLDNVSKTGGHLASNLGAVELTVALHRVLETPKEVAQVLDCRVPKNLGLAVVMTGEPFGQMRDERRKLVQLLLTWAAGVEQCAHERDAAAAENAIDQIAHKPALCCVGRDESAEDKGLADAGFLAGDEAFVGEPPQEFALVNAIAAGEVQHHGQIGLRIAQTINARHGRDDDHILALHE